MADASTRDPLLPIGEVARRSGVPATAIRFYESAGLVPEPERAGGKRRYESRVVRHLAFLRAAQSAGFTLGEIRELLAGGTRGFRVSKRWREMAERKLGQLRAELGRIREMERWLRDGLACDCLDVGDCRLAAEPRPPTPRPKGPPKARRRSGGRGPARPGD
jgi:MerR family redox-sensitive transcriptional activator SoxR